VQQLLALAFVAKARVPGLASYPVYAWRVNGARVVLVAAEFSCGHLEALGSGTLPDDAAGLQLLRSAEADLSHAHGRREAVRMMVGVYRALRHRFSQMDPMPPPSWS
jgi:hypothetical protein